VIPRRTAAVLLLVLSLSCTSGDGDADTTAPTEPAVSATERTVDVDATWQEIVPGGDCRCADGSEFSFWVRQANVEKVVFYLQDGGACWSAATCAPGRDLYNTTVDEGPTGEGGIFDVADERNPFADHSIVYVPYCTGDAHLGNAVREYTPDLVVHHAGYANGTAALDHLAATFPGATEVVVIGESAGSIAAPLYAGLVSDLLPDARITVLSDGSGAFPDASEINELVGPAWGTSGVVPTWPGNAGLTEEPWSFPGLFIQSGRHDPQIVFARHDYADDETQASFLDLVGIRRDDLLSLIDANEAQIEGAGVNLLSFVAPGGEHTVLSDGPFYREAVQGQSFVDWVASLIAGEPVGDVHCTECRGD